MKFLACRVLPDKKLCGNCLYWLNIPRWKFFHLTLKNRVCPEIFHCVEYTFTFRIFEQLVLALKNRVVLKFFTVLKYFLSFRIFEQFALALKNRVALNSLYWIYIFYHSGFLSNLRLPWKQSLPWIHCIEIFFIIQDFWATCSCPENSLPWIHCIEYIFFIIQDFWATCACPEKYELPWKFSLYWNSFYHSGFLSNLRLPWKQSLPWIHCTEYAFFIIQDFSETCACPEKHSCPEIFQDGGRPPTPDPPPRTPMLFSSNRLSKITELYWNSFKACFFKSHFYTFCAILNKSCSKMLHVEKKKVAI